MTDLNSALKQAMNYHGLVTKSVAICEVVDAVDGDRKLVVFGSDTPIWDAVGMLTLVCQDLIDTYVNIEGEDPGDGEN